jgi:predicted SprT family Zn-dependent metalloprotease
MELNAAIIFAKELMNKYGVLCQLTLNRSKRAGAYAKSRNNFVTGEEKLVCISVSTYFIAAHDKEMLEQVMLHEIAHCLTGLHHGHDSQWKMTARNIGYRGGRTLDSLHTTVGAPEGRFKGVCPKCGKVYFKYRGGKRVISSQWICRCGSLFRYVDKYQSQEHMAAISQVS